MPIDRRTFLKRTSAATIGFAGGPYFHFPKKSYRLALIGCGWWGNNILREAIMEGSSQVVGLCDVDEEALKSTSKMIDGMATDKPVYFKDFRECIEKSQPEIVIVATPDHWHALPAIDAIKNGAHVYLEKPIGHTINEGKAILRAARSEERIVQVGTHRRVSPHNISGMEFLRSGKVGEIVSVKAFVNYNSPPGKASSPGQPPEHLDWDYWVGPAPDQPFLPQIHPRGFRQFLDFANGTVGDWGIHWFDQILWWTEERYPKTVYSTGGRFVKEDSSDAPDTQYATFEFETFTLYWEHKLCNPNSNESHNVGCYFYGTEGTFHMGWLDGWTFYPAKKGEEVIHVEPTLHDPDKQNIRELWADFLKSVQNKQYPVSDVLHGHLATNMSLLAMISYKLGRSVRWDGQTESFRNDNEANKLLSRPYRPPWIYPV